MNRKASFGESQLGAVLVVAMIMLLITTLIALSVFDMGSNNVIVVHNLESRQQVKTAAEAALEVAVTDLSLLIESLVVGSQAAVFLCEGRKNHKCFDIDGDGSWDIEVDLTTPPPRCVGLTPVLNDTLDPTDLDDQGCFIGVQQVGAVDGAHAGGLSLCSGSIWDLRARAVDLVSDTQAHVRQGISIRVSNNDADTACP
jgi:hypothetical protein